MDPKEPYVEPTLEELGSVGDVTGVLDIGGIFDIFSGLGGKKKLSGSH